MEIIADSPIANSPQETELIDINPHAPYGSKQNRKAARDRIAERY